MSSQNPPKDKDVNSDDSVFKKLVLYVVEGDEACDRIKEQLKMAPYAFADTWIQDAQKLQERPSWLDGVPLMVKKEDNSVYRGEPQIMAFANAYRPATLDFAGSPGSTASYFAVENFGRVSKYGSVFDFGEIDASGKPKKPPPSLVTGMHAAPPSAPAQTSAASATPQEYKAASATESATERFIAERERFDRQRQAMRHGGAPPRSGTETSRARDSPQPKQPSYPETTARQAMRDPRFAAAAAPPRQQAETQAPMSRRSRAPAPYGDPRDAPPQPAATPGWGSPQAPQQRQQPSPGWGSAQQTPQQPMYSQQQRQPQQPTYSQRQPQQPAYSQYSQRQPQQPAYSQYSQQPQQPAYSQYSQPQRQPQQPAYSQYSQPQQQPAYPQYSQPQQQPAYPQYSQPQQPAYPQYSQPQQQPVYSQQRAYERTPGWD